MDSTVLTIFTLFVTLLFFISGFNHLRTLESSVDFLKTFYPFNMANKTFNYLVIIVASSIEFLAPLVMVLGILSPKFKFAAIIAAYLLAFFIFCTLLFIHNPYYENEFQNFLKNLSFLGGVLLIAQSI